MGQFQDLFSVEGIVRLIEYGGLYLLFLIVFAETGLLVGFFLPGDSLMVAAGFFCSQFGDKLPLSHVLLALPTAAILGDQLGYLIGNKAGAALYNRPESRWFKRERLLRTKAFFEHYGPIALVLARFMPFARTFCPVVAGIAQMRYARFLAFSIVGGLLWVCSMTSLGFSFGQVPFVRRHIDLAVLAVIFVSVSPVIIHALKARRHPLEHPTVD